MSAHRLLNTQGEVIGTVTLDRPALEQEIVNGQPELRLGYTNSLTNVLNFILEVVPPKTTPDPMFVRHSPDRGDKNCLICKEPWPCGTQRMNQERWSDGGA